MDLIFQSKFFNELTTRELSEIVRARTEIFLLEQRIICQDFDGVDLHSLHCFLEENGKLLAYLRAYRDREGVVRIGRVLSRTHGMGHGSALMRAAIPEIQRRLRCDSISLHSQKHAQGFYERIGFVVNSPEFLEEGIPHVSMILNLKDIKGEKK